MINSYFIFDIETCGLSPRYNSIIQLSGVKVDKSLNVLGEFNEFARPYTFKHWSDESQKIHKISKEKAQEFQKPELLLKKLRMFLQGEKSLAVCHAGYRKNFYKLFDYCFLVNMCLTSNLFHEIVYGLLPFCCSTIISAQDFEIMPHRPEGQKLNLWADFLNIKFSHHNALEDAHATFDVVKYQIETWNRSFLNDALKKGYSP